MKPTNYFLPATTFDEGLKVGNGRLGARSIVQMCSKLHPILENFMILLFHIV